MDINLVQNILKDLDNLKTVVKGNRIGLQSLEGNMKLLFASHNELSAKHNALAQELVALRESLGNTIEAPVRKSKEEVRSKPEAQA